MRCTETPTAWGRINASPALFLPDVCEALGLSQKFNGGVLATLRPVVLAVATNGSNAFHFAQTLATVSQPAAVCELPRSSRPVCS